MKTEFEIGVVIFICITIIPLVWDYLSQLKGNKE